MPQNAPTPPADPAKRALARTVAPVAEASTVQDVATVTLSADATNSAAPLTDPVAPVSSPVNDALLAYVRRLITHTLFNKTPVVRSVSTEQILTGQVLVRIDAYDPNGDPLTYDIIQPTSGGLVLRDPLTGTFVYTPTVPVIGDPEPVEFTVVVRDDSEDLPGLFTVLHSVARILGLAQADNYSQRSASSSTPSCSCHRRSWPPARCRTR